MDLREKPSIIQRCGEMILRLRLILVFVFAIVIGIFFSSWKEVLTTLLALSETVCIKISEGNFYTLWPLGVLLLLVSISKSLLAGKNSLFPFFGLSLGSGLLLFGIQGSEVVVLPLVVSLFILSIILLVVVKKSWAKSLFPALIVSVGFVGAIHGMDFVKYSEVEIFLFGGLIFIEILTLSLLVGSRLNQGETKNGALLFAFKKELLPGFISVLLSALFFVFIEKNYSGEVFLKHGSLAISTLLVSMLLGFPLFSFTPLENLRSKKRSISVPANSGTESSKKK